MPISQQGALNTTALVVPDLYVQIVPPQNVVLNGVPTNVGGFVGTASYGPVNQPTICSDMADYAAAFGPIMARKYDLGTPVATAVQQGASNFRCVRVTDGTDTAATYTVATNAITFTALYTGSLGNTIAVAISAGSKAGTFRAVVSLAAGQPELYDNISGTGNAFWVNLAAAINTGDGVLRGPSKIILATAGVGTTAVAAATYTLAGGTDGVTTLTAAVLIGQDTLPRKGMYALRSQGCSVGVLSDADDSTQWTTQAAFGLSEGIYMIAVSPAGDTIAGITGTGGTKATAGLDSYGVKLMFGDWIYWTDQTNGILRLVSPQGFAAGRLLNLSPEQSSLNKQLYSVVGTQKSGAPGSGQSAAYSSADLQTLIQAGVDVISNPQPGGSYWGVRAGHNSSSNAATNGDNYTRLTNYIAATLAAGMGIYVGQVISATLFKNIAATLNSFFQNLLGQGILGTLDGSNPWSVVCNLTNNPFSRTSLGYVQADVNVQYQGINEKFIVNMQGGQTVVIASSTGQTFTAQAA